MKSNLLILLLTIALFFSIGTAEAKEKRQTKSGMSYYIVKPGGMNPGKPNDILIMLHGRGDNPDYFMSWCNFSWAGRYVRVYPFQTTPPMFQPSDLPKMADIINDLKKEFKVGRIIAFGFSNGAQYAFMLGLQYPLLISGVIPHSGAIPYPSV
ncbi:MAG: alpha/beta hydrolase family protein, partial [Planctomycetota bacterium]